MRDGCDNDSDDIFHGEDKEILDSEDATEEDYYDLLDIAEVPDYAKEEAITTGYRKPLDYLGCVRSILWLHNETVNIWTHLLGFFFFFFLMVDNILHHQDHIRDHFDYWATNTQLVTYQVL